MPRFAYRAKDLSRRPVEGTIEAESEAAALSRLGSEGVFPISIAEVGLPAGASRGGTATARVSQEQLAYTTRQLADLLGGGLPLLNALTLLARQTDQPGLRRVIDALANAVRDGRAFSDALSDYPAVFPTLYRNMIRAGEVSGGLERSLSRLADLGEREAELRSRIITAAVYPLFVLGFAVVITVAFLTFVIPKLSDVFLETDQILPLPTRILLAASGAFRQWWWALLLAVAAGVLALRSWQKTAAGRAVLDQAVISIPAVGVLVRRIETARLARNLGTMASQGVPILQALSVSAENVGNAALRRAILRMLDAVREGSSLAAALAATQQFPAFVSNMVAVGEESGTIDQALLKVATAYEREIDQAMRTLISILEPVLLVVVGGIVMALMLAMLLPVFSIGLGVQ